MRKRTRSSYQQASANNQPLCERLRNALRRMRIVRTELQAWNGVSDRLSFFWPRRWLDPHYALPAGLGEEQWGASELRAYTVPPRSAMSGGRTGTRSARAKPCSDCASSSPIFREQAIEPIAGTHERSATKVFRAGLSTPGHPSTAQWDDVSCWVTRILLGFERGLVVVAIAEDRSGYVVGMKVHDSPQLHSRFKKAYCDPG
jgi:hypothetical protein